MKLYNESLAGQKLTTSEGEIVVADDGSVEVTDKDLISVLKVSGFKPKKFSKDAPVRKPEQKPEQKSGQKSELEGSGKPEANQKGMRSPKK